MRLGGVACLAWLVCAGAAAVQAAELTSGIDVDGGFPTYTATKCGGIADDIDVGKSLCFT